LGTTGVKAVRKYVGEIEPWIPGVTDRLLSFPSPCPLTQPQVSISSKRKKESQIVGPFFLLGSVRTKAARKHVGEIYPWNPRRYIV